MNSLGKEKPLMSKEYQFVPIHTCMKIMSNLLRNPTAEIAHYHKIIVINSICYNHLSYETVWT